MSLTESYRDKTFTIMDPDARIRTPADLMSFERYTKDAELPPRAVLGDFKRIPRNTQIKVDQIKIVPTGSTESIVFAHALTADGTARYGWTSTRNFLGKFVNETLGSVPPPAGEDRKGPNAAWIAGKFSRQLTLVKIVDVKLEIERIAEDTLAPYLAMVEAGTAAGVEVAINSGFRSYPEQQRLYDGFIKGVPGFNMAAKPGRSQHQNGIAFDIAVAGGKGNPTYDWLTTNAPALGFIRTVNGEPWHWEYDLTKAAVAVAANTFKTSNVVA
ncbi:M15 family metallopeptidase [Microvirga puerhi]|uniref:M15 family metallopeptidase n=1 Tax=Microvirga puerhi TaxID=2876078 RepID=A0ABS7VMX7_9HYPH|nr:M15 family metallopeptidase [Microvirga puerhi]MBZ6076347.1 M15 family metallopeptidase [Microvirga puerhi]